MAAIGIATTRLRLGAMVTPLARRRPWVVARQLAALDLLTDGRMVLGVGLGLDDSGQELSTFGEELDARTRAEMLDEALEIVQALLSGQPVHHRALTTSPTGPRSSLRRSSPPFPPGSGPAGPTGRHSGEPFATRASLPSTLLHPPMPSSSAARWTMREPGGGPFDIVVAPEPGWPAKDWARPVLRGCLRRSRSSTPTPPTWAGLSMRGQRLAAGRSSRFRFLRRRRPRALVALRSTFTPKSPGWPGLSERGAGQVGHLAQGHWHSYRAFLQVTDTVHRVAGERRNGQLQGRPAGPALAITHAAAGQAAHLSGAGRPV